MAWKTLTKEAFPQINKRQYLVDEYTVDNYTEENPNARISTYRSKAFYIIAIDSENRPARCRNCEAQLDDRYILRLCQAEHMTQTLRQANFCMNPKNSTVQMILRVQSSTWMMKTLNTANTNR